MEQKIEVVWGWESDEAMRSMQEAFASVGVEVETRRIAPAGNGVGFYLGVTVFDVGLGAFLAAFAGAAGTDAWKGVKRVVVRLKAWFDERYPSSPPNDRVTINLRHAESGVMIYISSDLPDEALRQLSEIELAPGTEYIWDEATETWGPIRY